MSRVYKSAQAAALALCLGAVAAIVPAHAARNSGWWVVLGSVKTTDNNYTPQVESEVGRIEVAARRCGLKPFHDFSSKFRGFSPGFTAVVIGAYPAKANADRVLAKAKKCVADAYIARGSYAGE